MNEKKTNLDLVSVPDDVILDEAVKRLKGMYHRKTGKDVRHGTCFEIVANYSELYHIDVFRRTNFYQGQPTLRLIENLD